MRVRFRVNTDSVYFFGWLQSAVHRWAGFDYITELVDT